MLQTYFSIPFHVNCVLQGHVDKTKEIGLNNKNVINIDTETVVLTQGKFPIYNDSFLDEFPPVWLFAAVDLAFSLAGVSLGGAPFLSRSTEPVRTASKSSFASAILSKSYVS